MKSPIHKICLLLLIGILLSLLPGCNAEKPGNPEEARTWEVRIDKVHDVLQGHTTEVKVKMEHLGIIPGGFELNIGYDPAVMLLTQANLGQHLADCGWEHFSFQYTYDPHCGSGCPTGQLKLIGIADLAGNGKHPDFDCIEQTAIVDLANLTFLVSNDRQYECSIQPIRFFWNDCTDNTMATQTGDTLAISRYVWDYDSSKFYDYTHDLPSYFGAPDSCLNDTGLNPKRMIDFHNGALEIVCSDSIDDRGGFDFPNRYIAEAVMLTNYFINGLSAFGDHAEESIEDSDYNGDGLTLTIADLVYLVRYITGDAVIYPSPVTGEVHVRFRSGIVGIYSPVDLGAALFVFRIQGEPNPPILEIPGMDLRYAVRGNELRVLVYCIGDGYIPAGRNQVLNVGRNLDLISAEVATYEGAMIESTW
jgi:hypothetical protein